MASEICKPFFDFLRKNKKFEWISEHEKAFEEMNKYLPSAPLLAKPEDREP